VNDRPNDARIRTTTPVILIGAGPAGLAVSACLCDIGIDHALLEREAHVGAMWRRHYDRLHLHTIKEYSALPGMPWPATAPRYPSRAQVVEYLDGYAAQRAGHVETECTVHRVVAPNADDAHFRLDTSGGTRRARAVVVACGYNHTPRLPSFPGLDTFAGRILTAREYTNPTPFAGQRVLVVGCGNSGAEIALDLAEQHVDVSMVVRGPMHVLPRDLLGRPSQKTAVALSRFSIDTRDRLIVPMLRIAVGDLSRYGIVRPKEGPIRLFADQGRVPMLDIGTIAMIKAGRITVVPGVVSVGERSVRFAHGSTRPFDAMICATGYRTGLDTLVDGFADFSDARGRPRHFADETDVPGLHFVGYRNPPTGALREIALEAPRVARAIAARLAVRSG
jgi:NADPH-dependent glutamate synthase beta subunit-like oxidoreductase